MIVLVLCAYKHNKKNKAQAAQTTAVQVEPKQEADPENPQIPAAEKPGKDNADAVPDDTSTISPQSKDDDITSVHSVPSVEMQPTTSVQEIDLATPRPESA